MNKLQLLILFAIGVILITVVFIAERHFAQEAMPEPSWPEYNSEHEPGDIIIFGSYSDGWLRVEGPDYRKAIIYKDKAECKELEETIECNVKEAP